MTTKGFGFDRLRTFFTVGILFVLPIVVAGCSLFTDSDNPDASYEYQFEEQPDGWTPLFSNYGVDREDEFELESGYRSLPEPLDTDNVGYYLSGKNLSDDLNMLLKHRIDGLAPETTYRIIFEISFATEAPSGCAGVGGAPGESVTVHADASPVEPTRIVDDSRDQGFYRLGLAKNYDGSAQSWYRATEIGDVANSRNCEEEWQYEKKTLTGGGQMVKTDANGEIWLLIGTRSGFEATTSLYYTEVKVRLRKD